MSECGKEQSPFWQNRVLFAQQTRQFCAWLLGGKCPHCWAMGPWLRGSEGPPVARFGETTGWRSANIAVNSSSQSPWLPAGVYLKIPDVKVTEHFVGPMSTTSRCQSLGKLMYSDETELEEKLHPHTTLVFFFPYNCYLVICLDSSRIYS